MLTVSEATEIILSEVPADRMQHLPLELCLGRTLAEDLVADRPFPPFDRVMMDGIAISYQTFADGKRVFEVEGVAAAGSPMQILADPQACLEVMTGAMLPQGTDTVIRYEDVEIQDGKATVNVAHLEKGKHIHWQGSDRQLKEVIVSKGRQISSAEIGVAATVGRSALATYTVPKALVISTGDELVPVDHTPLPYQIRQSNGYTLSSLLSAWGLETDYAHLVDEVAVIEEKMQRFLQTYALIILSGGVSKGKFDFIPQVMASLGVQKKFHRVAQRPGKPFWFGVAPSGTRIFALPGNPVSSFVCTLRYIQPWLRALQGLPPFEMHYAVLQADIHFKPDLTYFAQVNLSQGREGILKAYPVEGHGSGDLANLVYADAIMELPQGRDHFKAGEVYEVIRFR
ncbi:MAG: molybdopterin molybdotransferase MoeA [Bacteroidota bacterium]